MDLLAFSFGGPEMIWVFVLALLLFGAKKLPGLARGIGESMGEFKKARNEFERELHMAELEAEKEEIKNLVKPPKERRLEVSTTPETETEPAETGSGAEPDSPGPEAGSKPSAATA